MKKYTLPFNYLKYIASAILLTYTYLTSYTTTFAAEDDSAPEITIRPLSGFTTLSQAINTLISVAMFGGALVCFGYLLYGAFKYVTARDNASDIEAARKTMINAIVGLVVLGLVVVIFQVAVRIVPGLDKWFSLPGGN